MLSNNCEKKNVPTRSLSLQMINRTEYLESIKLVPISQGESHNLLKPRRTLLRVDVLFNNSPVLSENGSIRDHVNEWNWACHPLAALLFCFWPLLYKSLGTPARPYATRVCDFNFSFRRLSLTMKSGNRPVGGWDGADGTGAVLGESMDISVTSSEAGFTRV
jgi:hypothetical protein